VFVHACITFHLNIMPNSMSSAKSKRLIEIAHKKIKHTPVASWQQCYFVLELCNRDNPWSQPQDSWQLTKNAPTCAKKNLLQRRIGYLKKWKFDLSYEMSGLAQDWYVYLIQVFVNRRSASVTTIQSKSALGLCCVCFIIGSYVQ
jgi:hypothetical protein